MKAVGSFAEGNLWEKLVDILGKEKISQFLLNLLYPIQPLFKKTPAAHGRIASLEVSDGADRPVGFPGLADLLKLELSGPTSFQMQTKHSLTVT